MASAPCETVFSFENFNRSSTDFYEIVFFDDWASFDSSQKVSVFNDFLKKELSYIVSKKEGIDLHPLIQQKLQTKKKQVIINNVYEHLISRPLISEQMLLVHMKNLKHKAMTYHLLIGFKGSEKDTQSTISQDSAFVLINSLYQKLSSVPKDSLILNFGELASQFSIDPSAKQNFGLLGWVPWGRTVMSFQKPLFDLAINEVSQPVLTEFGYHLILKTNQDLSSYSYFSKEKYIDLAYKVGQSSLSFDSLRVLAEAFDSSLISDARVVFNEDGLSSLFDIIENKQKESKLLGNKNSLLRWLESSDLPNTTLLVYNGRGVGIGWLINQIKGVSSTRLPQITNISKFKELILNFVLHDLVIDLGYKHQIEKTSSYKREFLDIEKNILLNEFVSDLLNNIPDIDSLEIKQAYDSGVFNGNYTQPKQALFSEIRHNKKDSLVYIKNQLASGLSFDNLLIKNKGDIRQPITYKQGSALSQAVFDLKINEVSNIIKNNNGSYSIVRLEKILDPIYFGFKDVFAQIKRKLIKEKQDYIKNNVLSLLLDKYKIYINKECLNF